MGQGMSGQGQVIVRPVRSRSEKRAFLLFPWQLYRDEPLWVPPLWSERKRRLESREGPFHGQGEAEFFVAWRGGQPVGTLCAANDVVTNAQRGRRDCMIGFLEYVQDWEVFTALLSRARAWAADRGLESLYGPFNLDYEDGYGVLVEGRDRPPVMLCGHTPAYYLEFMERYGFAPARGDNLAYAVDPREDTPALRRLAEMSERARRSGRFTVRSADLRRWDEEVEAVWKLINPALAHLPDFIPWQREALVELLSGFRLIADPELVLMLETEGRVIGFFPGIPDVNERLIHANGLRYPWDTLRLLLSGRKQARCLSIKSVLVLPEYWGTGAALLLFDEMLKRVRSRGYEWVDLSLTSADNPKTPALAERLGAKIYKRYRVFRLQLA